MPSATEKLAALAAMDRALWAEGVCFGGIDEAGRGPLCGPVVAACVVMPEGVLVEGVNDSKKLSEAKREKLFDEIRAKALFVGIGQASAREIDTLNILGATKLAMRRAAEGAPCTLYLVDGNQRVDLPGPMRCVIGGDGKCFSIAAASIIAKVTRDRQLIALDRQYPGYGFARHKGYGTAAHAAALREKGPTPEHRTTFLTDKIMGRV